MTANTIFKDGTKAAIEQIKKNRDAALMESAIAAAGECIVRCPVDTGHLRASITYIVQTSSGGGDVPNCWPGKKGTKIRKGRRTPDVCREDGQSHPGGLKGFSSPGEAYIGTNVEYAPYVEYGTKYQKAQPYMRPGAVASEKAIASIFEEKLGVPVTVTKIEEKNHGV